MNEVNASGIPPIRRILASRNCGSQNDACALFQQFVFSLEESIWNFSKLNSCKSMIMTSTAIIGTGRDFTGFSLSLLELANQGLLRMDFIREVLNLTMEFSGCDKVDILVKEGLKRNLYQLSRVDGCDFNFRTITGSAENSELMIPGAEYGEGMERICRDVIRGGCNPDSPNFTERGSFWTGDTANYALGDESSGWLNFDPETCQSYKSIAVFALNINHDNIGLMILRSIKPYFFTQEEILCYEDTAKILGIAITMRRVQIQLRERVKELTCLYGIAKSGAHPELSLDEVIQNIAELLPPGWLYPEIARGRITFNGKSYHSRGFSEGLYKQSADIEVDGSVRGVVEVIYTEERPELDEGPFLKEERSLINAIARELGIIIERRLAEEEKARLQKQLRHADRLATIGQLAAGVAHELNEPLGNILGFAQLSQQAEGLPEQVNQDLAKIVESSLHARDVIKKLLIFARQTPSQLRATDLNRVVNECISFFRSRFTKEGIELRLSLQKDLSNIAADPAQMNQVLVNLVVNSMQAMPEGGLLSVMTWSDEEAVNLSVEDTGVGIDDEDIKQIFLPFFTTKDVADGTGLGLAVVHGIVTAHGGNIKVESEVSRGSKFVIRLPIRGKK